MVNPEGVQFALSTDVVEKIVHLDVLIVIRACLNNRWQSHVCSIVGSVFQVFSCLLHTCGISIALLFQSLDPRWGLGARGLGDSLK